MAAGSRYSSVYVSDKTPRYWLLTDLLLRTPGKARLAVLFSGGIDSTIITHLANRYVAFNAVYLFPDAIIQTRPIR